MSLVKLFQTNHGFSKFLQTKSNAAALRLLPRSWGQAYMQAMGLAYYGRFPEEKEAVVRALEACRREKCADRLWPQVRNGIVAHYHEKLLLASQPYDWIEKFHLNNVRLKGREVLDRATEAGRGVILVTGHYGAVELIPAALALRDYPVTIMVHCKTAHLRNRLEDHAARMGARLIDPKAGSVVFTALEELKKGRILMTQCDELDMWRPHPRKRTVFLNQTVPLDRSLEIMARKSGAEVIFGLNHRLGNWRYQLAMEDPFAHPAAARAANLTELCLTILSERVLENPEAWYEWAKVTRKLLPKPVRSGDESQASPRILGEMALHPTGGA